MTLKGQDHDPNMHMTHYLENGNYRLLLDKLHPAKVNQIATRLPGHCTVLCMQPASQPAD